MTVRPSMPYERFPVRRLRRVCQRPRLEQLEERAVPTTLAFPVLADGVVADRDLDGIFEVAHTTATTITDRSSAAPDIGRERGILEFDLGRIARGTPILSARLGFQVTSFTTTSAGGGLLTYPQFVVSAFSGDGAVTTADATAAGITAASGTINATGYREFDLDGAVLSSFLEGAVALRLENSVPAGDWFAAASLEDQYRPHARLLVEIPDVPTLDIAIADGEIGEADGAAATVAVLTRTGDLASPLTVALTSSDPGRATVPPTATFSAGRATTNITIAAVDNAIADGDRSVRITAAATMGAQPGILDETFGVEGLATTPLDWVIGSDSGAIALQPDGKILAAGEIGENTNPLRGLAWQLTRRHPDGSPDLTFGTGGVVITPLDGLGNATYPAPHAIVVQPDGKILVGGKLGGAPVRQPWSATTQTARSTPDSAAGGSPTWPS